MAESCWRADPFKFQMCLTDPEYAYLSSTVAAEFALFLACRFFERDDDWPIFLTALLNGHSLRNRSELVETFADQAVIAIENARLIRGASTSARRPHRSAGAADGYVGSAPGHQQLSRRSEPVFATMLENAVRICDATFGNIYRWDGEPCKSLRRKHTACLRRITQALCRLVPSDKRRRSHDGTKTVFTLLILQQSEDYIEQQSGNVAAVELGGVRTFLAVPMLKENELIGAFTLYRQEVRPFTDKQIALVRTSPPRPSSPSRTRGCSTRSATTTCWSSRRQQPRCCKVISRSTVRSAARVRNHAGRSRRPLCEADNGVISSVGGRASSDCCASYGAPPECAEARARPSDPPRPWKLASGRAASARQVQIPDVRADPVYRTRAAISSLAVSAPSSACHAARRTRRGRLRHLPP